DAYVSPTWYASKAEHGRVVPTWNYVTAHVYGPLVIHDDPVWVDALVRRLTDRHERGASSTGRPWTVERPWTVDDAPARYVEGQLRAIVGVEVVISRIEAKLKLSQNRPAADIDGVIAGLQHRGQSQVATAVAVAEARPRGSRQG
ncbi:MAG TPA: FMN-binding negative transcriptional regulator, partial [Nakamurella sp.]|nr:FMN-binding negative transcriptional regulator [Nakamurella sp.]